MRENDDIFAAYTNEKYGYDAEELYKVLRLIVCLVSPAIPFPFNSFIPFLSSKVSTVPISKCILQPVRGMKSVRECRSIGEG